MVWRTQRLNVKVMLQGHGIYPWIVFPVHISSRLWMNFVKIHSNISLGETMCRIYDCNAYSGSMTHLKVMFFTLQFVFVSYLLNPWIEFQYTSLYFLLVRQYAKPKSQLARLKVKVTIQGHRIHSCYSCSLHNFWALSTVFMNLHPNVHLSETMCRTYAIDSSSGSLFEVMVLPFNSFPLFISWTL